ncbi:MAG: thioredoxin-dependent thiol peroxidase [Candidatus Kryptonium sp.]|nr:thioredoxin-dependent thiol peroxidase [Candidatus Kryptonium sp.]MDW8108536.1 thioredoxin-dependent thiol peroxidase [Candidatus Kryptonium sp.]
MAKSKKTKTTKTKNRSTTKTNELKIGQKAPDFTLPSDTGEKISLKDFRGKKVVLYFYPKDDTPGCTKEACSFRDNINLILERGAVVIGVSADSVDSHKKFKEKYNLNFPLLSDEKHKVLEKYGVWKEKSLYGKKFMGIERTTFIIDEQGKIAHIFRKVKVDGHTEEVLKKLDELSQKVTV